MGIVKPREQDSAEQNRFKWYTADDAIEEWDGEPKPCLPTCKKTLAK
jgi:hypothetical protein